MKLYSRIITLVLTLALCLSLMAPAAGAAFSDVGSSKWYAADVNAMEAYGILNGTGNGRFSPDMTLTLAQAITMASRVYAYVNKDTIPAAKPGELWYTPFLVYANQNGICKLGQYGTNYDSPCNRLTMAYLFATVFPKNTENALNTIDEIPDVQNNKENAGVYYLYRQGVLTGNDKYGTFAPYKSITRAETAAILHRVLDVGARKSVTLQKAPSLDELYQAASIQCVNALKDYANRWGWGSFQYSYYDIDNNGVKELLLRCTSYPETLTAIYTIVGDHAQALYIDNVTESWNDPNIDTNYYIWDCYFLTDGTICTEYSKQEYDSRDNLLSELIRFDIRRIAANGQSLTVRESLVYEMKNNTRKCYNSSTAAASEFYRTNPAFKAISESYFDSIYFDLKGYAPKFNLNQLTWKYVN